MNIYTVCPLTGNAPDWDAIAAVESENRLWTPPLDVRMTTQLCYGADALWLHQRAWERDIRAAYTEPLSMVCQDSCMEFFCSPQPGDGRYFNFEVNPNGCLYLGFGHDRHRSVRLAPKDAADLFAITARRCDGGWEIFYRIPASFFQVFFPDFAFRPGMEMRANFYKCGDLTPIPHYFSWNLVTSPTPDFHRPADFGLLRLV